MNETSVKWNGSYNFKTKEKPGVTVWIFTAKIIVGTSLKFQLSQSSQNLNIQGTYLQDLSTNTCNSPLNC